MKKFNFKNSVKVIFSSKIFIAILFTLVGISGTVLAKSKDSQKQLTENIKEDFDSNIVQEHHKIFEQDPFFSENDIFTEIAAMEKRMNEIFVNHHKNMQKIFNEANKSQNSKSQTSIKKSEDDKNYYYELNFYGFKKEEVAVKIENNSLSFAAKNQENTSDKEVKSQSKASFYYSFSLPKYNEKIEPKIVREDNKIVVSFEK